MSFSNFDCLIQILIQTLFSYVAFSWQVCYYTKPNNTSSALYGDVFVMTNPKTTALLSGELITETYSFFCALRTRAGNCFDLPAEARWEFACRAGTTAALNSGKNWQTRNPVPKWIKWAAIGVTAVEIATMVGITMLIQPSVLICRTPGEEFLLSY